MFEEELNMLMYLANKSRLNETLRISTQQLAADMNFSQQTASRKLIELEQQNYITRQLFGDGIEITLLPKSKQLIEQHYALLKSIYESKKILHGRITAGLGEGKFYMQVKQYKESIEKKLFFTPFPGTLNLKVIPVERKQFLLHKEKQMVKIEGFTTPQRTFGSLLCYPVNIKKGKKSIYGALIIPERTNHPEDVAELIAPIHLRTVLKVNNDDILEIESVKNDRISKNN